MVKSEHGIETPNYIPLEAARGDFGDNVGSFTEFNGLANPFTETSLNHQVPGTPRRFDFYAEQIMPHLGNNHSTLIQNVSQEHSNSKHAPSVTNCYVFKSRLQEYAQKVKLTSPTYNTIKEGPSHNPSFRSTVILGDVRYDSLPGFSGRKAAEQSAAEVALKALSDSGAMDECISQPVHDTGLSKNLLQEYAQKMNYAIPSYECQKDEKYGMVGHFSCTVDIGGIKYIGGAARSKKEADLKAARTALLAIQSDQSVPSTNLDSSSTYTVVPYQRKVPDLSINAQETAPALKAKKSRYKKNNPRKRRNKYKKKHAQNVKGDVEVDTEGHEVAEVNKSAVVPKPMHSGFPPAGTVPDERSKINDGERPVEVKYKIQYSGGDFVERQLTTNSHQSTLGGSNLELSFMPTV